VVNLTSGTPEQARSLAGWPVERGGGYLDGAAMSGTRLVAAPEALFLYSGAADSFATAETALTALGRAVHLGTDAGTASLYDTALLGMNLSMLSGFYHAAALLGTTGVEPTAVASVAIDYLPFVTGLLADHARQVEYGKYSGEDGTLDVYAAAVDHLVATSRDHGIDTTVPDGLAALIEHGTGAGHGHAGLVGVIATPSETW